MVQLISRHYWLRETEEYSDWFEDQTEWAQTQIHDRLLKIVTEGHFGDRRHIDGPIWELKWHNGRRIYYAYLPEKNLLLLIGGSKHGQEKDIKKAKKIIKQEA